jgi:D-aminopeptidase
MPRIRELNVYETVLPPGPLNGITDVADALMTLAIEQNPYIGVGFAESGRIGYASVNPVVGETSDAFLSDVHARPLGDAAVRAALADAHSGAVAEGVIGAGTGTSCYGWKGGIGSASRVLPEAQGGFTLGALVQTNFGAPPELTVAGVRVGRHLQPPGYRPRGDHGSIMIVLATDAPLDSRQLGRLCHRAAFGLARTGSTCHTGSGDFVIAFSTTYRVVDRPPAVTGQRPLVTNEQALIQSLGLGVIEAVEEAIYNSLFMARAVTGRDGHVRHGLPVADVVALIKKYGQL